MSDDRPQRKVVIHEPQWHQRQTQAEPAFVALRLADNDHAPWREFRIFVDFFRQGRHRHGDLIGIFSPKFQLKTKVTGAQFIDFARAQAQADVCIINAFPRIPYYAFNVWMQGDAAHPGLNSRAQALLDAAGIGWQIDRVPRQRQGTICFGNFWVGTPRFWEAFVGGVLDPLARFLEAHPDAPQTLAAMEPARYMIENVPYLPFITERLFSTFLSMETGWKVADYPLGPTAATDTCLNDFQRTAIAFLQPRVDRADHSGVFDEELMRTQEVFSRLVMLHNDAYYQLHPHPHVVRQPAID